MADQKTAERNGKAQTDSAGLSALMEDLPLDQLKAGAQDLLSAVTDRAVGLLTDKLGDVAGRLTAYAENGGGPGIMAALKGGTALAEGKSPGRAAMSAGFAGIKEKVKSMFGGGLGGGKGGKGGKGKMKIVNIIEEFDVGLPLRVAYNQWTQFQDYPSFTRKVQNVDQQSDEKVSWKAKIFLSNRTWESTIVEQIPDTRIVWRSKGAKGYVDGAVTFHELAPTLTRILLVLEYHPQGLFEKTGNIWRAQGRRVRSDFKHIKRHMMSHTILEQEDVEGWRGEIRDSEVVKTHEEALQEEQEAEQEGAGEDEGAYDDDSYDEDAEGGEDEGEQEADEDAYEEDEDTADEDTADEDTADEDTADEDTADEDTADEDTADEGDEDVYEGDEEEGDEDEDSYDEDEGDESEADEDAYEDEDEDAYDEEDEEEGDEDAYEDEDELDEDDQAADEDEDEPAAPRRRRLARSR